MNGWSHTIVSWLCLYWFYMLKLFMTRTTITSWMLYAAPLGRRVSTSAGLFALLFLHYTVPSLSWCEDNKCLEGSFSFDVKKKMVEDHALVGHVIESVTVADPLCCFERCQSDCRCISFNYLTNTSQENCQLNNENMNTNSSGLKLIEGPRYYGLVVNYNMDQVGNYWDNK